MTLSYTYDGVAVTHKVQPSAINIPTRADNGEAGMGGIPVEDPTGNLAILGHRPFTVVESACAQPRLWSGWTQERGIGRSLDRGLFVGSDARIHDMNVVEYNAIFSFLQIGETDGKRPAETWLERLTWILESDYLSPFVVDTGYVASAAALDPFYLARPMDAADFIGQYPSAVLDDLAQRLEGFYFTYFAFWDPDTSSYGLFMNPDSESIGTSSLSISNDIADVDSTTCFAPDSVARLAREPDQVYSGVTVVYSHGTKRLYRSRASTATTYTKRETEIERPFTGGAATASKQAEAFLDRHSVEMDRITCTIIVPAASAGLVRAGQHIAVKFTHLPGYETSTTMRVVGVTPTPTDDTATHYELALELVALWAPTSAAACADSQWTSTDLWPLGGNTSDAEGMLVYFYNGNADVSNLPNPGYVGGFAFWVYGAGGQGTVDEAGWQTGSIVRMFFVGPGTVTIHTATQAGSPQTPATVEADLYWSDEIGGATLISTTTPSVTPADIVVTIPDDGHCLHIVDYHDTFGINEASGFGFAGAEWAAAAGDTEVELPPTPGSVIESTVDPTVDDDSDDGYQVGQIWINTSSGYTYILVDATVGAAVWTLVTTGSSTSFATSDGSTTVDPTVELTFVGATLADLGSGVAEVTFTGGAPDDATYLVGAASGDLSAEIVVGATPGGELGGTWASPTVDATHAGSTHLALGSTSSTAAAGDHTHAASGIGQILISDTPSTPLVFADLLQNEAQDDLLYADP